MLIGELCKRTEVTRDTVRYYYRYGILKEPVKAVNGYGSYNEEHYNRITFIKKLQSFGFTLKEIKEAIELEETGKISNSERVNKLKEKLVEVEVKIKELREYRDSLNRAINYLS